MKDQNCNELVGWELNVVVLLVWFIPLRKSATGSINVVQQIVELLYHLIAQCNMYGLTPDAQKL